MKEQILIDPSSAIPLEKKRRRDRFLLKNYSTGLHLLIIVSSVVISRIAYVLSPVGQTGGADEAVFGLMAQQIRSLKEFPIYCWEANYAGAVVSYAAAVIFAFFGSGFPQLRMAMFPIVVISPIFYFLLCRELFNSYYALVCALFVVFCPYLFFYYTFSAHGGYGETYLATVLIIYLSWMLQKNKFQKHQVLAFTILGFICGFSFYILFLILPAILAFALPCLLALGKNKKNILGFFFGSLLGVSPMLIYNISTGGGTAIRAASRSLNIGREALQRPPIKLLETIVYQKIQYLIEWIADFPEMLGQYSVSISSTLDIRIYAGFFLIVVLTLFVMMPPGRKSPGFRNSCVWQFKLYLLFLIIFQWIANLNRARHLLPILLAIPIACFSISEDKKVCKRVFAAMLLFCAVLNAFDLKDRMKEPMFDPFPVAYFMEKSGIHTFYGSYWTTYPIMFASEGRLIGAPYLLRPNEILSDRRPAYSQTVDQSISQAFVFSSTEKYLIGKFSRFLADNKIDGENFSCPNAVVFYDLTEKIKLINIGTRGTNFDLFQL